MKEHTTYRKRQHLILLVMLTLFALLYVPVSVINHYFDTHTARQLLKHIPPQASVSATSMLIPHLALRDSVYLFPIGLLYNPEYYLLLHHNWSYHEGDEDHVARLVANTAHY